MNSGAALSEVVHLVGETRHEMEIAWEFIRSGAIRLAPRIDEYGFLTTQLLFTADVNVYRVEGRKRSESCRQ